MKCWILINNLIINFVISKFERKSRFDAFATRLDALDKFVAFYEFKQIAPVFHSKQIEILI